MTIQNRNELILLYDAQQANPNGDPLSANDKPRIDKDTRKAIVTDVRLKRYLRDQLEDDGYTLYIRNPQRSNEKSVGRDDLFEDVFDGELEEISEDDNEDVFNYFLDHAIDARLFGATFAFSEQIQEMIDANQAPQYTGPLQFTHGQTLNRVVPNDESKKLSTVVTSGGDAEQGTFAEDNRLEYALVRFHGVINENAADSTHLTSDDIELLDSLYWRAIKNQTLTRSKMGHNPQLYMRIEYEGSYHDGSVHNHVSINDELSSPHEEMRSINDVVVDVTELLDTLEESPVKRVVVKSGKYTKYSINEDIIDREELYNRLENICPEVEIPEIY